MTKMNKKDVGKVLVVTRLTGTFAFASLVKTAELQFTQPPEVDNVMEPSSVTAHEFNIIQVIRDIFDDNDSTSSNQVADNGGTKPTPKPVRPSGNKNPGIKPNGNRNPGAKPSGNKNPGAKPSGNKNPGAKPNGNSTPKPGKPSNDKDPGSKPQNNGNISFDVSVNTQPKPDKIGIQLLNERDALNVEAKKMTKTEALRNITPYKFTLRNTGNVHFNTNLKADILNNTLNVSKENVRVYIEDNYGNKIYDDTFSNIDSLFNKDIRISRYMDRSFKMWAWLDSDVSKDTKGKFEFKLNAVATQTR